MTLPTVITSQPKTINSLQYNQFRFVLNRMPETIYFCQGVKFPGIQSQPIIQSGPFATPIKRTPNRLAYEDLQIDFIVSEDFKNWLEINNWLTLNLPNRDYNSKIEEKDRYCDGALIMLNSASRGFLEVTFTNMFPITLGGVEFTSTVTDAKPVISLATFGFTGYTIRTGNL